MGQIIDVPVRDIHPTEHMLREESIGRSLKARVLRTSILPPIFIYEGRKYLVVDGHNRLVVAYLAGDDFVKGYIPANPSDDLVSHDGLAREVIAETNDVLHRAFLAVPEKADELERAYQIHTIPELIDDFMSDLDERLEPAFPYLSDINSATQHFHLPREIPRSFNYVLN